MRPPNVRPFPIRPAITVIYLRRPWYRRFWDWLLSAVIRIAGH